MIRARFVNLLRRRRLETELQDELRHHVEALTAEYQARGLSLAEARTAALRDMGGLAQTREAYRDQAGLPALEGLWRDIRVVLRSIRRTPGVAMAVVAMLAIGIGASAGVFTVINAVLLRPLPYAHAERCVTLWSRWRDVDKTWLSAAELLEYGRSSRTLEDAAGWSLGEATLTGHGDAVRIRGAAVTGNTFDVLGASPLLGRTFTTQEDRPGGAKVLVISHALWRAQYGADPGLVGRSIVMNGDAYQVVGIMGPEFRLPTDFATDAAGATQLWLPLALDPVAALRTRGDRTLYGVARLRPGETASSASEDLAAMTAGWTRAGLYPSADRFSAFAIDLRDDVTGTLEPTLVLLACAVGFLWLIGAANVVTLTLVRMEGRQRELALRCALGAGRWRVLRLSLIEGLLLAVMGAFLGVGLAAVGLQVLFAIDSTILLRPDTVTLDWRVLVAVGAATVVTACVISLAPAWHAWGLNMTDALKDAAPSTTVGGTRQRVRFVLITSEIALTLILAIGAALMVRSLGALQRIDLGFDPSGVFTARLSLPEGAYASPDAVTALFDGVLERVRGLPGVTAAGAVRALPLADPLGDFSLQIDGASEASVAKGAWQVMSDGAAEALRQRLVLGRLLGPADRADSMPVVVVNETMARRYWSGRSALGRRIRVGADGRRPWLTVVGVVADAKHNGVDIPVSEQFVVAHRQWAMATRGQPVRSMTLVVRTSGDTAPLAGAVREAVRAIDGRMPLSDVRTFDSVVRRSLATPRLASGLLALFATMSLLLAMIGVYAVIAYFVSQRRQEIGIRIALGADRAGIRRLVIGRGLLLTFSGLSAGAVGAWFLTRFMRGMLYGVQPTDPVIFIGSIVVLALVAMLASYVPAWRAARIDPLLTLRS
jgi:putative ABC transport system permease protein